MGICFLGIGDCNNNKTNVTNAINFISSTTFNTMASIKSSQTSSTTAKQDLTVSVGTDSSVLTACIEVAGAAGYNPSTCSSLMSSNLLAEGITQSASIIQLTTADITSDLVASLTQQLTQQIDQKIQQDSDAYADVLQKMASAFSPSTSNTSNSVSSSNFVNANFTVSSVSTMVNDVNTTQGFSVLVQNATNSSAINIAQTLYASATEKLLMSNSTTANIINDQSQSGSQSNTSDQKGLADYISALGAALEGLLTGAEMPLIIGAAVVAGIIALVVVFNFLPKGGGAAKAAVASRQPAPPVMTDAPPTFYPPMQGPAPGGFTEYGDQAFAAYQQAAPFLDQAAHAIRHVR